MAATTKLNVRCVFADETKATIAIDNLKKNNLSISNIKSMVANFNNSAGGTLASKMKSKNGFNWIGIDKVTIVTTERLYYF